MVKAGTVSVVIPTYNHGIFIRDAIESALGQSYEDREIIVVDDGSTDNTRVLVAAYAGRVTYLYQQNRGLSAARNTGIRSAKGEYVALLDADDSWLPGKLEKQMALFVGCPDLGAVSCGAYLMDADGKVTEQFVRKNYRSKKSFFEALLISNVFSGGSCAVVRKECFSLTGLFDEMLKAAEDWDMWLRLSRKYNMRFVEEPLTRIRVSVSSMSAPANAERMLANELRVLDKLFALRPLPAGVFLRSAAYANRFFNAAWAYSEAGDLYSALHYIGKAFGANPLKFLLERDYYLVAMRIMQKMITVGWMKRRK